MKINITKAHGTKNTFIIIFDSMHQRLVKSNISKICEKYQTDGLLLLSEHNKYDYKMDYYNNDGTWETMCANGARCAALYMFRKNQIKQESKFITGDGVHKLIINNSDSIDLSMIKPSFVTKQIKPNDCIGRFIDSGAKHFVTEVNNITSSQVKKVGSKIRYNKLFINHGGVNVNFLKVMDKNNITVYTYEKGIENMVLSCGSGSVAAAFYAHSINKIESPIKITTPGGRLSLKFDKNWDNVWLCGPAHLYNEEELVL